MSIHQQLKQDRIQAMRDKDVVAKKIIMFLLGEADVAIKDGHKDATEFEGKPVMSDKYMLDLITKARKNAIDNYVSVNGEDALYDVDFATDQSDNQYLAEVRIYHRYIPTLMSHKETAQKIDAIFDTTEVKNPGVVIGQLNKEYGNTIDKKFVSTYTNKRLKAQ